MPRIGYGDPVVFARKEKVAPRVVGFADRNAPCGPESSLAVEDVPAVTRGAMTLVDLTIENNLMRLDDRRDVLFARHAVRAA
jgi:hypothetical protein